MYNYNLPSQALDRFYRKREKRIRAALLPPHVASRPSMRLILTLCLLCALLPSTTVPQSAHAREQLPPQSPSLNSVLSTQQQAQAPLWITPRGGKPFFVIGANYEGPTDRAWQMWEDDKFDPELIGADFARARSLGINTLRIFVQRPLRDDINEGDFSKLDTVMSLAQQHDLWIIFTFTDWPEPDMARAADLNARIATRLASVPRILAYDVKNEPQWTDVVGAIFPEGVSVPLQTPDLVAQYGERVTREQLAEYRQGEGRNIIPARMDEEQAYMMANYYRLFREFLDAGSTWVGANPGTTTLDYIDSPDSSAWASYLAGLDATLAAWINTQMDGVRRADPGRPITTGYSNTVLAKLPSNRNLDFTSIHRFASHGTAGLNVTFRVLDNLQRTFAGKPVLLEEFGYPGQAVLGGRMTGFDPRTTANLESAIWAYLYSKGFAGGAKWMLNNFPQGSNPAENSYGLFDNNNQPKPSAHALQAISDLFSRTGPGIMSAVVSEESYAAGYAYAARDALIAGGKIYTGTNISYISTAPSQLVVGTSGGGVTLFSTDVATAELNLPAIFGVPLQELGRVTLTGLDPQGRPWTPPAPTLNGDLLRVNLAALFRYRLTVVPRAMEPAEARPDPSTVYFPQTRHNLSGEFLLYWKERGGLSIFGYPLSEPFTERGYTVQYFERNRFELHPENQPPYNVLLGRLGADQVAGRVFPVVAPFESGPNHRYFPETGHSLGFAFLGYWNRNGGLAQFGYPISEEIREVSPTDGKEYTVQYFERARFEYHPEYKGTSAEVLLGLLGVTTLRQKGWMP